MSWKQTYVLLVNQQEAVRTTSKSSSVLFYIRNAEKCREMFDYLLQDDSCYVALNMLTLYHLFLLHALSLHIRISQLINK